MASDKKIHTSTHHPYTHACTHASAYTHVQTHTMTHTCTHTHTHLHPRPYDSETCMHTRTYLDGKQLRSMALHTPTPCLLHQILDLFWSNLQIAIACVCVSVTHLNVGTVCYVGTVCITRFLCVYYVNITIFA